MTTNTDARLPCPFCGQEIQPDVVGYSHPYDKNKPCPMNGIMLVNGSNSLATWNTRTPAPSVTSEDIEVAIGKPMGDLMAMDRQGGISYSPHALAQVAAQAILTAFHVSKKEG